VVFVVAVVAFLIGAAASAFAAALYVRRSAAATSPAIAPAPNAGLASRALGALDVGVVVLDRD
jgi:hypothetical protein